MISPPSPSRSDPIASVTSLTSCRRSSATSSPARSSDRCRTRSSAKSSGSPRERSAPASTERSPGSGRRCSTITRWGQCIQPATSDGFCSTHSNWHRRGVTNPDPAYEEKVVKGLITPSWDHLTVAEAHALLNGRYKGDGRRIDQYVLPDPLGYEPKDV